MDPMRLAASFARDETRMARLDEATSVMRTTGFEAILRRLGEPAEVPLADPNHAQISAFAQAEARGWFRALEMIFDFRGMIEGAQGRNAGEPDFGAD